MANVHSQRGNQSEMARKKNTTLVRFRDNTEWGLEAPASIYRRDTRGGGIACIKSNRYRSE